MENKLPIKMTTITVDIEVRDILKKDKIHHKEPLNEVIRRKYGLKVE